MKKGKQGCVDLGELFHPSGLGIFFPHKMRRNSSIDINKTPFFVCLPWWLGGSEA